MAAQRKYSFDLDCAMYNRKHANVVLAHARIAAINSHYDNEIMLSVCIKFYIICM